MSLCKNAKLHATMFCFWSRNVSICCFNCCKFDITCPLEILLYLATKLKTRYFICDTTLRNTKQPTVHSTVTFRRDLSSGKGTEWARSTTGGSVGSRNYGKKNSDHIEESIIILQEALIPCGTKFLRVLILVILPAIRKNNFPPIKITANIFPAKIYFRVNIL